MSSHDCKKHASLRQVGAAVLGVPVKPTIKEVNSDGMVVKTLIRANLWEVQTPQVCCSQHIDSCMLVRILLLKRCVCDFVPIVTRAIIVLRSPFSVA